MRSPREGRLCVPENDAYSKPFTVDRTPEPHLLGFFVTYMATFSRCSRRYFFADDINEKIESRFKCHPFIWCR